MTVNCNPLGTLSRSAEMALQLTTFMTLVNPNPSVSSRNQSMRLRFRKGFRIKASFYPTEEPILKEALKEPVAFLSGMFAGLLRLDLNEDPLKDWITRTVEASGISEEAIETESPKSEEDAPQQIEIE